MNRKLVDAEDRVRERIGRHLDDDIAQRLALVCIELTLVSNELSDTASNAPDSIQALQQQTSSIATDVMALSHELRSYKIEYLGIETVMQRFCREFAERQKAEIDFRSHDLPRPLPLDVSISLFEFCKKP